MSSWTSISPASSLPLIPAQSPFAFKRSEQGHARSASGAILESYGLPIEAFTFPPTKLASALLVGVSLADSDSDSNADSDDESALDDHDADAADEVKHAVRKELRDYVILSASDVEDVIAETSWRAGDAATSLKALAKFARGREWLLERPNL